MKKERKMKKWIQTKNPPRFPRFTVGVVTFFVKIFDDFLDFVSECVSFPRKINNPFWEVIVFSRRKVAIFIGREKTHFTDENQRKIAKVSPRLFECVCVFILFFLQTISCPIWREPQTLIASTSNINAKK